MTTARPRFCLPRGMKLVHLLCGSWTALVLIFLYSPVLLLVAYSFNESKLNILWTGFTWKWYGELAANGPLIDSLINSLMVAVVTTVCSVVLGTLGAWLLHRYRYPARRALDTLIFIPMAAPEIILGISLLVLFASLHFSLGFTTVIISHITFCFPFVLAVVQARLHGLDPSLEEAALDLGATPLQAFWKVTIPYLLPSIVAGALMAFTLSMDEVIVTFFVYGPGSMTLPVKVFGLAKIGLNPMLNALSALFIAATAILVVAAERLKKRTPYSPA
jgi:spermidine/putrescine transport system permease protein